MNAHPSPASLQRGVALITSLLLMLIITILALSMFRSFGTQEKIAGNIREKDRALHAAESAQQYAEWWLLQGNNSANGSVACNAGILSANLSQGQICDQVLAKYGSGTGYNYIAPPWNIGTTYIPPGMGVVNVQASTNGDPQYALAPMFFIADIGTAADGNGEDYQIDAIGYGSSASTVAVVESTYEVKQGTTCKSCL